MLDSETRLSTVSLGMSECFIWNNGWSAGSYHQGPKIVERWNISKKNTAWCILASLMSLAYKIPENGIKFSHHLRCTWDVLKIWVRQKQARNDCDVPPLPPVPRVPVHLLVASGCRGRSWKACRSTSGGDYVDYVEAIEPGKHGFILMRADIYIYIYILFLHILTIIILITTIIAF